MSTGGNKVPLHNSIFAEVMLKIKILNKIPSYLNALLICMVCIFDTQGATISTLYNEAQKLTDRGDYPAALNRYSQIISQLSDEPVFLAQYMKPYSDLLLKLGRYEEAERLIENILPTDNIILKINFASAKGYQGKYDEASDIFTELLQTENLQDAYRGRILQNLGFLNLEDKNYSQAEQYFASALPYFEGIEAAIVESNYAVSMARNGKLPEALKIMNEAVKKLRSGGKTYVRDYYRALRKLGEIHLISGDKRSAASELKKYFKGERDWLLENLPRLSKNERLDLWLSEKDLLSRCLMLEDYDPEFLYEAAMFRRLISILGINDNTTLEKLLKSSVSDIRKSLKKDEAAIEIISFPDQSGNDIYAAVLLTPSSKARYVKLFDSSLLNDYGLLNGTSLIEAITSKDSEDKNTIYRSKQLGAMIWEPIASQLPASVKTIYFAPEGVFHFLGIENLPLPEGFNPELRRVTTTSLLTDRKKKSGKGNMLVVGGLDYASLPDEEFTGEPNHDAAEMMLTRLGTTDVFRFLPGTRIEADSVASIAMAGTVSYRMGEGKMKQIMPEFDIVHIATHGYSLDLGIRKRPEFLCDSVAIDRSLYATGLALTGANVASNYLNREDGILSAREICDLDLSNIDFAVLSACQTAQGDITDEGCAGLVRGLKNAGVKTVMASLWSVNDTSTMLFMQEFYRYLNSDNDRYKAYRAAQNYLKDFHSEIAHRKFSPATLSNINEYYYITTTYDDPFYWAPFILIDDI